MSTKERPILFSAPMVRAILEGTKTQTRMILKLQPHPEAKLRSIIPRPNAVGSCAHFAHVDDRGIHSHNLTLYCPYGMPGDRLWVRETFCIESSKHLDYEPPHADGRPIRYHEDPPWECGDWWEQPHYRATDPPPELEIGKDEPGCLWRPSIFMPRWASRITLEITGVKVERLQAISEADARAEGIADESADKVLQMAEAMNQRGPSPYASAFQALWQSINGDGSWHANPWVWVVEFKRVEVAA